MITSEHCLDHDVPAGLRVAVGSAPHGATIAVAGGDGTIGTAAAILTTRDNPLAILPAGTGNDIARALAIPLDRPAPPMPPRATASVSSTSDGAPTGPSCTP